MASRATNLWIDLPDQAVERHRVLSEVSPIKDLQDALYIDEFEFWLHFRVELTASG